MLLPSKHLPEGRSLLFVGARILSLLSEPKTVSRLWDDYKATYYDFDKLTLTYDWFVLALDTLYTIGAIGIEFGKVTRIRGSILSESEVMRKVDR